MTEEVAAEEVVLTPDQLERFATGSLTGYILSQFEDKLPKSLKLVFTQTTMSWKRDNGGPDSWIIPEHTLPCIVGDVANLIQRHGVRISVEFRPQE